MMMIPAISLEKVNYCLAPNNIIVMIFTINCFIPDAYRIIFGPVASEDLPIMSPYCLLSMWRG